MEDRLSLRTKRQWSYNPSLRPDDFHCLSCQRFSVCAHPLKDSTFFCIAYSKAAIFAFEDEAIPGSTALSDDEDVGFLAGDARYKKAKQPKQWEYNQEEEDEFTGKITQLIADESLYPVPADIRIDDRDLKLAPNYMEFVTGKAFLNKPNSWAKQIEIGLNIFAEYCPRCSDPKFLRAIPVDATLDHLRERIVMLHYGKCPQCGVSKSELWLKGELRVPVEMAGLGGQRGSKTHTIALCQAYTTHGFLKLPNPNQVFGVDESTLLHGTFVGLSWQHAKGTIWDPFCDHLHNAPWFAAYNELLTDYGNKVGDEIIKVKDTFVHYRHKRLFYYPSGPDRRKLRGFTRVQGGVDEIGHFNARSAKSRRGEEDAGGETVMMNAEEVYVALRNSLITIRSAYYNLLRQGYSALPIPLFSNISSPWAADDMICQLHNESKNNPEMWGFHWATWEMNPQITRESLQHIERRNPRSFRRDWAAIPPMSALPFIESIEYLKYLPVKDKQNGVYAVEHYNKTTSSNMEMRSAKLKFAWTENQIPKLMCIDAGYSNNSFAIVVGHCEAINPGKVVNPWTQPRSASQDEQPTGVGKYLPIVDVMIEIIPTVDHALNYDWLYNDVLCPLVKAYNVTMFSSDRWQNLSIGSALEEKYKLVNEPYSVKYEDCSNLRDAIYNIKLLLPRPEMKPGDLLSMNINDYPLCFENKPVAHFLFQCLKVEDHKGKEVTKGEKTTDDLFRALTLFHHFMHDDAVAKQFCGSLASRSRMLGTTMGRSTGFQFEPGLKPQVQGSSVGTVGGYSAGPSPDRFRQPVKRTMTIALVSSRAPIIPGPGFNSRPRN